ncbi:MAG: hypothetical protein U0L98_04665 [Clostridia bacterium]|nr:hypothetical protein [Clostridia bacterium]
MSKKVTIGIIIFVVLIAIVIALYVSSNINRSRENSLRTDLNSFSMGFTYKVLSAAGLSKTKSDFNIDKNYNCVMYWGDGWFLGVQLDKEAQKIERIYGDTELVKELVKNEYKNQLAPNFRVD